MTGANDTGTVQDGGSIDATGGDAVQMLNSGQSLANGGAIATSAGNSAAVNSQGDAARVVNDGLIRSTGDGGAGILVDGSDATVKNNGTIAVSGNGDAGIIGSGSNLTVANTGLITVDGEAAAGIIWENDGLRVDNSGSIVVSGLASIGIGAGGDNVVINNTGSVEAYGDGSVGIGSAFGTATINNDGSVVVSGLASTGILALGTSPVVSNAGSVEASGDHAVGIGTVSASAVINNAGSVVTDGADNIALATLGDGTVVTNSGRIISDQGRALYFGGSDATLNLLARTAIQGPIVFDGTGNTVSFGRGLNAVMTFSGAGGLPGTILTDGRPFVVDGNTVAVIDVTGFASTGTVVQDLTGSVAEAIDSHVMAGRADNAGHSSRAWITPFGVGRVQSASGAAAGFRDGLGGIVAGAEAGLATDFLGGAFIGAAGGETSVNGDAQDITHRSVFGGGYLAYDAGARFADLSLTFGRLNESSSRRVANNLVPGGIETAQADYHGSFVSPSVTVGARMPYGANTLIPSLRLRYAGLFLGDYAETGAADGLTVAGRDIHLFEARGQLALAMAPVTTDSGVWQTTWRAGIDGTARNGADVSATVLGQPITFSDGSRKDAVRGFIGADIALSNGNGMTFGGNFETSYGSDGALVASALAHLDVAF